jgi:hypothetical protein
MEPIRNRVAESELVVFNLEKLWDGGQLKSFDIASHLYEGLILREKPYREALRQHDWSVYRDTHVCIYCSTEAVIPIWAYMLAAAQLSDIARSVTYGTPDIVKQRIYDHAMQEVVWEAYKDRIVVVKGCASEVVPVSAYVSAVTRLQSVARKIMFGEPCSAVPIWRRPKSNTQ